MPTTATFTGWVQGRNHDTLPIEITGVPLPYDVIRNVRVSCYFPQLMPHELAFYFDELPKDDFAIGQAVTVTIVHAPTPVQPRAPSDAMVELAPLAETGTAPPPPLPPDGPQPGAVVTTEAPSV